MALLDFNGSTVAIITDNRKNKMKAFHHFKLHVWFCSIKIGVRDSKEGNGNRGYASYFAIFVDKQTVNHEGRDKMVLREIESKRQLVS